MKAPKSMKIDINVNQNPHNKDELLIVAHLFLSVPDEKEKIYYSALSINGQESLTESINFVVERVIAEAEHNLPNY